MACLRCKSCDIKWPADYRSYRYCPVCKGQTAYDLTAKSISNAEAVSLKAHADFERFYEAREAELLIAAIEKASPP